MTTTCGTCGSLIEEGVRVCAHCGCAVDVPACVEAQFTVAASPAIPAAPELGQVPISAPMFKTGVDLEGIGGWLILVALSLAISPFVSLHGVYTDFQILYGSRYHMALVSRPAFAGVLMFEAITNSFFLVVVVCLNFLFYMKKRIFPTGMIIYLAAQFLMILTDHLLAIRMNPSTESVSVVRSLLTALVWIPYFLRSQRVEATFVN